MSVPDRFNVNTSLSKNWEHVQSKFVGTGHPDMTKHEWATNHHRDTNATIIGHNDLLSYIAVGLNQSIERTRTELLDKMIQPVGPPPLEHSFMHVKPLEDDEASHPAKVSRIK